MKKYEGSEFKSGIKEDGRAVHYRKERKYIREAKYPKHWTNSSLDAILRSAETSTHLFIGDLHPVPACRKFVEKLLPKINYRDILLALEFVPASKYAVLNEYTEGMINSRDFRDAIHFKKRFGYPWASYGSLIRSAVHKGVDILPVAPREHIGDTNQRDARISAALLGSHLVDPDDLQVVLIGDAHIAPTHLPYACTSIYELTHVEYAPVIVYQNILSLYPRSKRRRPSPRKPVVFKQRDSKIPTFCVITEKRDLLIEQKQLIADRLGRWESIPLKNDNN